MGTFFAVLPVDGAAEDLRAFDRPELEGVRWEPMERLHVTIRYFDSIDPSVLDRVVEAGGRAAASIQAPRVVLGPATERLGRDGTMVIPADGVAPLAVAVDAALIAGGLEGAVDERGEPFYGHLTLARLRRGARVPDDALGQPFHSSFVAQALVLIDSTHTPEGRRYEIISDMVFGEGAS